MQPRRPTRRCCRTSGNCSSSPTSVEHGAQHSPNARLNPMPRTYFRRLCVFGAALAFCVVVLGAWVRLSNAGLGCPDWPGCYGHLTAGRAAANAEAANAAFPNRPVEEHKAFKEMFHRFFAGGLVIVVLAIAI